MIIDKESREESIAGSENLLTHGHILVYRRWPLQFWGPHVSSPRRFRFRISHQTSSIPSWFYTSRMTTLPILCFNDVYRVSQKYVPQPGAPASSSSQSSSSTDKAEEKINVSQFGQLLFDERDQWADRQPTKQDGSDKDGLVLFAGDVFNPSVESSVTRGSHMVPIMNALKIDCACIGNHDFDFGELELSTHMKMRDMARK